MPIKVINRDYDNQYRPEDVDWLIGNTGDWQVLNLDVLIDVSKEFTQSAPLILEENKLILSDGTFWSEAGFDVGDVINLSFRFITLNSDGTTNSIFNGNLVRNILFINGDELEYDGVDFNDSGTTIISQIPTQSGSYRVDRVRLWSDKRPQGIALTYGHLKNSEKDSDNLNSFIDGSKTVLTAINTHISNTLVPIQMEKLGIQSGMSINSAETTFIQKQNDNEYLFRIQIEYLISSFFNTKENFENRIGPEETLGEESLTDNFEIIAYPEWNNPNTQITSSLEDTRRLGNTGWFEENFNGLEDEFTVDSISYEDVDTGQTAQGLSFNAETKVTARISGIQNLALGISTCGFGFIWVTEDEDAINNKETSFHQNSLINTGGGVDTGIFTPSFGFSNTLYQGFSFDGNTRMDIRSVRFSIDNGVLVYEANFRPTPEFAEYIKGKDEDDRSYAIWVSIADHTLVTNFSDRVNKLLDYGQMQKFIPSVGEWSDLTIELYPHDTDQATPIDQSKLLFLVEDELMAKVDFRIDKTEDIPTNIRFIIQNYNQVTEEEVELESTSISLSQFPVVNGVPEWQQESERGFNFSIENDKNTISLRRNESLDIGDFVNYILEYPFKIRWEDWIANNNISFDFFNREELNNGRNNDWHGLQEGDWILRIKVEITSTIDDEIVIYENLRDLPVIDYEENDSIDTDWKFIRSVDNTELAFTLNENGEKCFPLIEGEDIIVKAIHTKNNGDFGSVETYYSKTLLEQQEGPGFLSQHQISTEYKTNQSSLIQPIDGEDRLKITLTNTNVIETECKINSNELNLGSNMKFTSRFGCKNG